MKIDFVELAQIEKQAIPPTMIPHLETLNHVVNTGIQALASMAPNVCNVDAMRRGRISRSIESEISPSKSLYEAVQFASQLLKSREQAMNEQLSHCQQSLREFIPTHEAELQQQLSNAMLSGDSKTADKALEGLQKLHQRTTEKGELTNRTTALGALLDTFQQAKEILTAIEVNIAPSLWLQRAKNLHSDYLKQREQIAVLVDLHHQIRACEWLGKNGRTLDYVSPLADTIRLFEFDQTRHQQAIEALRL